MSRRLLSLEECKKIQLDILDNIDGFCKANGLKYSLAYGTLIGAVRHGGYIPWDDDIDIMMPRSDYDFFIRNFTSSEDYVLDLSTLDTCMETFTKVCRKNTFMVDKVLGRSIWGVNVDVFPIDGAPDKDFDEYYAKMHSRREDAAKVCKYYKAVSSGKVSLYLKYLVKRLKYLGLPSTVEIKSGIVESLHRYPYENSSAVGVYFASEKTRTFMPKEIYDTVGTILFEGKEYSAIKGYDEYLTRLYGKYMELPPVEKRVSNHLYDSFVEE